ncbi:MAG: DNA polymerase III subunit gamma/tau [Bacilli bacterium]
MNYKVLYRKYRPDNFESLVDQSYIVRILQNSIVNNKLSHAYIFSGPRGTGKTSTARILAKAINCLDNVNGEPCGKCVNCVNFNDSPDIIEIDAASNNGVDEIRELINNVKLMPSSSKYKVYIIDEVHMLSQSAFNALLLTLEEPPKHVIFILATTNIENVPITILSRCQKFEFSKISNKSMLEQLIKICDIEKINYTTEGLEEIVMLADGGLRDALSMLDQLSKEEKEITLELVAKEVGSISLKSVNELVEYVDKNDINNVINVLNKFKESNISYKIFIKKLIDVLSKNAIEILEGNGEFRLTYKEIKNIIFELNDCILKINISVNPYLLIEMILLSYVNVVEKKDNSKVITENIIEPVKKENKNVEVINNNIEKEEIKQVIEEVDEKISLKQEVVSESLTDIRINNCFCSATKEYLSTLGNKWKKFIGDNNLISLRGLIADTMPVVASKEYLVITNSIDHNVDELNKNLKEIEKEFNESAEVLVKLVIIKENRWKTEKEKYINNLKSGYKYTMLDEEVVKMNVEVEKSDNILENIANDLFDISKIEIN